MPRLGLILLLLVLGAASARAEVLTLRDVERRALAAGAAGGAKARTEQTDAELEVARAGRRPLITLNTEASVAPGGQVVEVETTDGQRFLVQGSRRLGQSGAFAPLARFGGLLSLQSNLVDFGRTASRIRAAEHRARSARADVEAAAADAVTSARSAYLAWTVACARVALVERQRRDGQRRLEMIGAGIAEGSRPTADRNTAEQAEVALEIDAADARAEAEHARLALAQLVGGPWTDSLAPDLGLLEAAPPAGASPSEPRSATALEHQARAAAATAESLAHDHAPVISTSAEVGVRGQATTVFPAYRVAVSMTVPLWDGGLGAAQARAAQAAAEALRGEAGALRKARQDAQQLAQSDLGRAEEKLRLAERLRRLAQDELAHADQRYQLGATDLRAVLDASERVSRADVQELAAKADRTGAWLRTLP